MVYWIRIWLWSTNVKSIEKVAQQIKEIAEKTGVTMKGPVPLPVKRMEIPVFRLPHGEGSKYWEHWEMRIHKRLIDINADERVLRRLMRIQVPSDVYIEIKPLKKRQPVQPRSRSQRAQRSQRAASSRRRRASQQREQQ